MKRISQYVCLLPVVALVALAACSGSDPVGTEDVTQDTTAGTCVFWQDCDDGNPCTTKDCVQGKCVLTPRTGRTCDDQNICTSDDTCRESGECLGDLGMACEDNNPCTVDTCDPMVGCAHENADKTVECDDGDGCTVNDSCQDGQCTSGSPKDCADDPSVCRTAVCEPETGECVPQWEQFIGIPCDDDNPCTEEDTCDSQGICFGNKAKVCITKETCKQSICNEDAPKGSDPCVVGWKDEGGVCDDLDVCTMLDSCFTDADAMICVGEPVECTSANTCETGSCVPGTGCVFEPTNEGAACSGKPNYYCESGQCICHPKCEGKVCGDDTCGGNCGTCPIDSKCFLGGCLDPGLDCIDGNELPGDGCFEGQITEFTVEGEGQVGGSAADVVALATGGYWIVWRGAAGASLLLRKFSADGWPVGEILTVHSAIKGTVERPRLIQLSNGSIVVVWSDINDDRNRVYFRILKADGSWETGQTEVSSGTGDQQEIDAAPVTNGNFVVVWERREPGTGKYEIRKRQYIPQGEAVADFSVIDTLNAKAYGPRITGLSGGGFVVTWEHLITEGGGSLPEGIYTSVYGWVFDWNGDTVGNLFNAWTGKILGPTNPETLAVGEGFELFWNGSMYDPLGTWTVQGRSFGPMGTAWSGFFPVSDSPGVKSSSPAAALSDTQAWVAWEEGDDVVVRRLNLDWAAQGPSFAAPTLTEGVQSQPAIAALPGGEFIVVWTGELPEGAGTTVLASRFTATGERMYR